MSFERTKADLRIAKLLEQLALALPHASMLAGQTLIAAKIDAATCARIAGVLKRR